MRTAAYTVACLTAALVNAHGDSAGAPRLLGRRGLKDLGMDSQIHQRHVALHKRHAAVEAREPPVAAAGPVNKRAGIPSGEQCGKGFGSCAAGLCCSLEGWCGNDESSCLAPDCQFEYGPACDANATPAGATTADIARPLLGSVPYGGVGIYDCVVPQTIALTFDDGPYLYTDYMLDVLKKYSAKATFFITGNNLSKGQIDTTWAATIKRMAADGHQIASHTWSHQNLSALTNSQRQDQMVKNEMALRNILGYFPTYMRPPYSECGTACQTQMKKLGYHITFFDLDTADYLNTTPDTIQNAKNYFDDAVDGTDPKTTEFLAIAHDIHYQTSYNLTEYMLKRMQTLGYKAVTVGDCLGDPKANWYRSSSGVTPPVSSASTARPTSSSVGLSISSSTAPSGATSTLKVSTDAKCGNGKTCLGSTFGNCCSVNDWCGSTLAYCGTGCKSAFGNCGSNGGGSPASTAAQPTSTALKVSTDATCGNGKTCKGSTFGSCCSQAGWCGSSSLYCGSGCQKSFGTCT